MLSRSRCKIVKRKSVDDLVLREAAENILALFDKTRETLKILITDF